MSNQWKLLITLLHGAVGEFLKRVDLEEGPPAESAAVSAPRPPAQPAQPATQAAAAKAEPEPTPGPAQDPEPPIVPPTIEELRDPGTSRAFIERFMVSRGFEQEALSKMLRPALNKEAIAQVEALNSANAGVRRRSKKEPGEKVDTKKPTAESALADLTPEQRTAVARMLNVDPAAADAVTKMATILGTAEAVAQFVPIATQAPEEEVAPVATVQISPEAPAPLASEPPKASRRPVALKDEPEPEAAPAQVAAPDTEGGRLLTYITEKYGVGGVLMNVPTSDEVLDNIPQLEALIRKGLKSGKPTLVSRYTDYTQRMGCVGDCVACPRGGAQMAACLTVFDKEYPAADGGNNVAKVIAGELVVRFKDAGGDVFADDFQDGPAVVEEVR